MWREIHFENIFFYCDLIDFFYCDLIDYLIEIGSRYALIYFWVYKGRYNCVYFTIIRNLFMLMTYENIQPLTPYTFRDVEYEQEKAIKKWANDCRGYSSHIKLYKYSSYYTAIVREHRRWTLWLLSNVSSIRTYIWYSSPNDKTKGLLNIWELKQLQHSSVATK